MAPLPRLAWLWAALLVAAAAARAQSDDARAAIMAQIAAQKSAAAAQTAAQKAALAAMTTSDPAAIAYANDAVVKAGLLLDPSQPDSLIALGWTQRNVVDLAPALAAASKAVADLHARYPSAVGDAYHNGTMTNIEDTFKLADGGNLERGCLSHQAVTFDAAKKAAGTSLEVRKLRENSTVAFPHNAVVVFPKGSDWKRAGVVLDGWKRQSADPPKMTYLFKDWYGKLDVKARLLADDD